MEWKNCQDYNAEERICSDVLAELFEEENIMHKKYRFRGPAVELYTRERVVDWMLSVSKKLPIRKASTRTYALTPTAVHLAVFLFDFYLESNPEILMRENIFSLAVVCLILGAKVEERDQSIPRINVMNQILLETEHGSPLVPWDFIALEASVLRRFGFNIVFPTPYHYLSHFLSHTQEYPDSSPTKMGGLDSSPPSVSKKTPSPSGAAPPLPQPHFLTPTPTPSPGDMAPNLDETTKYFAELTLKNPYFLKFKRSQVAATCVAAARADFGYKPVWTHELEVKTGYKEFALTEPLTMLKDIVQREKKLAILAPSYAPIAHSLVSPWMRSGAESSFSDLSPIDSPPEVSSSQWSSTMEYQLQETQMASRQTNTITPYSYFPEATTVYTSALVHHHNLPRCLNFQPSQYYAPNPPPSTATHYHSKKSRHHHPVYTTGAGPNYGPTGINPHYMFMKFPHHHASAYVPPGFEHRLGPFPDSPGRLAGGGGSVRKRKAGSLLEQGASSRLPLCDRSGPATSTGDDEQATAEEVVPPGNYPCKRSTSHPSFFCPSEPPEAKRFKEESEIIVLDDPAPEEAEVL